MLSGCFGQSGLTFIRWIRKCGCPGLFTKACHSFAPATRVLMADGGTRPIRDVNIGDKVAATHPFWDKTARKWVLAGASVPPCWLVPPCGFGGS